MIKLCDARGKQSTTLFFVSVSWVALLIKFLIAGMTLGPLGTMHEMSAMDFGSAVTAVLAIWLGREWTEKRKPEATQ
ncbi:hypothetical protein [Thalassolituus oleivorans]|jgi:hypothetical protein|uniref:Uncharacterized protein n=1 Tax=Thalassolituus oleivorans MIL-1 TaxID=1298593 RepID=M5DZI4_9GAMM|nr:hypothetical protein [Thalassolituus oleivorans]CCU70914.1 hypothetical protein TOL_0475 [Thalassolituus oleivorans MIL-1]